MASLITYDKDNAARIVDALNGEFTKEQHIVVLEKHLANDHGFVLNAPFAEEVRPGIIRVIDTFAPQTITMRYGESISIRKSGVRSVIVFYNSSKKMMVDKNALMNDADNAITEIDDHEIVSIFKILPGVSSGYDINNAIYECVKRTLLNALSTFSNGKITRDVFNDSVNVDLWNTDTFYKVDTHGLSAEQVFAIFLVYRILSMEEFFQNTSMLHGMYHGTIHPDSESEIDVNINIYLPLNEHRQFSIDNIDITANHNGTALVHAPIARVVELFKDLAGA